jgi:2,4-dienoyl-CoA reductase (NADPH2)
MAQRVSRTAFRKLFTPVNVGHLELRNRLVMPAIHLLYTPQGFVTDRLMEFYAERAAGGVGLIIMGGCPVDEFGGEPQMIGIRRDEFLPGLSRLTETVHEYGAAIAAQLYHAGRYSLSTDIGRRALAPSAVASPLTKETPREMTKKDIARTVQNFAEAARRAQEAGFDAVEISASAGYLISQFLSPITNLRRDEYGGDFQNRMRFGLEILSAVRQTVGATYPIIVRIAGNDFVTGSNTNDEARIFARELESGGADAIDVTGGWHETRVPQITMAVPRGAFSYLAGGVKQAVSVPVISSNRYSDPVLAERMLRQGVADLIAMGRPLIADPDLPRKAWEGRLDEIQPCVACNQGCFDHIFAREPVACLVNPRCGREGSLKAQSVTKPMTVAVVGGGPAGMQAAISASARGHQVTLWEEERRLGGQLNLAAVPPGREELAALILSLGSQLSRAGVDLRLGVEATADSVLEIDPDFVIVATGAKAAVPDVPGVDGEHVVQGWDVLADKVDVGKHVVVLGGGATGCLVALYLAQLGTIDAPTLRFLVQNQAESWETLQQLVWKGTKHVTLVEMLPKFGRDIGLTSRWVVLQGLARSGVQMIPGALVTSITSQGVEITVGDSERHIAADTVVLATGVSPQESVYDDLVGRVSELYLIGDAREPRRAFDAIQEGFEVGTTI